jgi:hypothetical protein
MAVILRESKAYNPIVFFRQPGVSESAQIVKKMSDEVGQDFISSIGFGERLTTILEYLYKLSVEFSVDDWDGCGAKPLRNESFQIAQRFALSLPFSTPIPILYATPMGDIVFEWRINKRQIFSVMVNDDNYLSYAGLYGTDKTFGEEHFYDNIPEIIIENINRVYR